MTFLATALNRVTESDQWIIDSGASQHMTHNRDYFVNLNSLSDPVTVKLVDGKSLRLNYS